jgi:integrase
MHVQWTPPKYTYEQNLVKAPLEADVDALISRSSRKMAVFLQTLKETGLRIGEAMRLEWTDIDFERNLLVCNKPEKGSLPRALPMSPTLKSMLSAMPRKGKTIFTCTKNSMYASYRQQRKSIEFKLQNDRLTTISFRDFRKFFATKHHAKYLNVPKTQQALGHKNINNTMRYIALQEFQCDDYEVQVAETVEEGKKLGEAGFEHYDTIEGRHLYRKRKL